MISVLNDGNQDIFHFSGSSFNKGDQTCYQLGSEGALSTDPHPHSLIILCQTGAETKSESKIAVFSQPKPGAGEHACREPSSAHAYLVLKGRLTGSGDVPALSSLLKPHHFGRLPSPFWKPDHPLEPLLYTRYSVSCLTCCFYLSKIRVVYFKISSAVEILGHQQT